MTNGNDWVQVPEKAPEGMNDKEYAQYRCMRPLTKREFFTSMALVGLLSGDYPNPLGKAVSFADELIEELNAAPE